MTARSALSVVAFAALTLLPVTIVDAHTVAIDDATVTASVLGEMGVLESLSRRAHVVKPCECQHVGYSLDSRMVMTYSGNGTGPIGIVHYVDLEWNIVTSGADKWRATIKVLDLDNQAIENVETGAGSHESHGTVHIGLGPGRYAVFLAEIGAESQAGYEHNHPMELHSSYLERGTVSLVTVGEPECGGQVTLLTGNATVNGASNPDVGKLGAVSGARFGMVLHPGDQITTADGSFVELTLPDRSTVRIAPNSSFSFDEVLCGPGERGFSARLFFGSIWSKISTVLGGEGKFRESTGSNTADTRGTIFTIDTDGTRTIYRVYPEPGKKSEVIVRSASGDSVIVHEAEETVVEGVGPASLPRAFKPQTVDSWWQPFDRMRAAMSIEWKEPQIEEDQEAPAEEEDQN